MPHTDSCFAGTTTAAAAAAAAVPTIGDKRASDLPYTGLAKLHHHQKCFHLNLHPTYTLLYSGSIDSTSTTAAAPFSRSVVPY